MSGITLTIIPFSTLGKYNLLLIGFASLGYIAYQILLSTQFARHILLFKGKSYYLVRSFIGCFLVAIGLFIFPDARDPLWLLFMFPIWRVLEDNSESLWAVISLFIIALIGNYSQISLRMLDSFAYSPTVLGETILRSMWLGLIVVILYIYSEFVSRTNTAESIRTDLTLTVSRQLFQADTLEAWCHVILQQALKIVGGTYATFQVCNRQTGDLRVVAVIGKDKNVSGYVNLLNMDMALSIKYTDEESIGLTGYVANPGKCSFRFHLDSLADNGIVSPQSMAGLGVESR